MQNFKLLKTSEKTRNEIESYMPDENTLEKLAELFSMFSDKTRIKILSALALSEMCVSDLSNILNLNQTTLSHQLKQLKKQRLVESRRDGKIIFYSACNYVINDLMLSGVEYLMG